MEFYDLDFGGHPGDAEHQKVWPKVLSYLALKWHKPEEVIQRSLENCLYGLPRGRVTRMAVENYTILHGNDGPVHEWEAIIRRLFNLISVSAICLEDEHEKMLPGHSQDIQNALGIQHDLGLKAIDLDETDAG